MSLTRYSLACLTISICGLCTHTQAQAQDGFNVENAAALEGLLRGVATRCTEPEFAKHFIDVSKSLVAFSLQGDGPISRESVEAAIENLAEDPRFDKIDRDKMCGDMIPKLQTLHKNRIASLQEAQRATDALRDLSENGGLQ